MKKKQYIKGLLVVSVCMPLLVHAQRIPKEKKQFEAQVHQNDSLWIVQVAKKKPRFNFGKECANCNYYWFVSGKIFSNQSAHFGLALHGACVVKNSAKAVIMHGEFCRGLQHGVWKHWNSNGNLLYTQEWKRGQKHGWHIVYENGVITQKILYKKNYKHGTAYYYESEGSYTKLEYVHGQVAEEQKEKKARCFLQREKPKEQTLLNGDALHETKETKSVRERCKQRCSNMQQAILSLFKKKETAESE